MKIAYKHLLRFLNPSTNINDLSDALFQLGHEHDISNNILDIEFTPNRGDCLSLMGLARDLNVFFKSNLNNLDIFTGELPDFNLKFTNEAKSNCPKISFLKIDISKPIKAYKPYLENYFIDLNLNKNNFFTDISNYLAYEIGQPTHCYDYEKINGEIVLKNCLTNTKFKTILGDEILCEEKDLVFYDNDGPINLAGIMGGKNTACSKNTKSVLIECAYFTPQSILGKAVKYDLHSDASYKFERGVDPESHSFALRRLIHIIQDHVDIESVSYFNETYEKHNKIKLNYDLEKINKILGTSITDNQYHDALNKLGFIIKDNHIMVPSYRSDISNQNDLAEELARVIGYDNIPKKDLHLKPIEIKDNLSHADNIKTFLIQNGFNEVINSPFIGAENTNKSSIKVDNPLDSNREYLRNSLSPSLICNIVYNEKRQKDCIKLFEISDVYTKNEDHINVEQRLAIAISGRQGTNYKEFNLKLDNSYLIKLFKQINIDITDKIKKADRSKIDSKLKVPIFSIELPINSLKDNLENKNLHKLIIKDFIKYKPISEYPSAYRDFSFSIKNTEMLKSFFTQINKSSAKNLKDFYMFDFYENKENMEIKVGYRFIFQSFNKTLTDNEINSEVDSILEPLLRIDSVYIPGMG